MKRAPFFSELGKGLDQLESCAMDSGIEGQVLVFLFPSFYTKSKVRGW